MISIPMGGADVVIGVQWLQSLGMVAFNFQELFLKFFSEGKEIKLRGITWKPGKIISSNVMTKLLKKEQRGVIAKLCSLEVPTSKSSISPDLKKVWKIIPRCLKLQKDSHLFMIMIMIFI